MFLTRAGLALATLLAPLPAKADAVQGKCLAEAMYFEARSEGWLGMMAVGIVIKNRVADPRYPSDICSVVRQGKYWRGNPVKHKCQFSYWCDGKHERPAEKIAWSRAMNIARLVLLDRISIESLSKATHYHTLEVKPLWSKKYRLCAIIGDHKFYDQNVH